MHSKSELMNEYAKIMWDSKNGTRKECGVNGKWWNYLIVFFIYLIAMLTFIILWVSIVGWFFLSLWGSLCIEDDDFYSKYLRKHKIYLTKSSAIYARLHEFSRKHPDVNFVSRDIYSVDMHNLSDSQWADIVKKGQYLRLKEDLSLTSEIIQELKDTILLNPSMTEEILHDFISKKNIVHIDDITHDKSFKNGFYIEVKSIEPSFFQTTYGQKIADKYKLSVPASTWSNKDEIANLLSTNVVNYGAITVKTVLNWT